MQSALALITICNDLIDSQWVWECFRSQDSGQAVGGLWTAHKASLLSNWVCPRHW